MKKLLFFGRALTLAVVLAAIISKAAFAATYTPPSTAGCSNPTLVQPFHSWGDKNSCAMVPGEALDNFAGRPGR
jgi:ABC-type sugar transport system substrate-binding protein